MTYITSDIDRRYPLSSRLLASILPAKPAGVPDADRFPEFLARRFSNLAACPFLVDLARIERSIGRIDASPRLPVGAAAFLCANPDLELLSVSWCGLPEWIRRHKPEPAAGDAKILVWRRPGETRVRFEEAAAKDLLALKLAFEGIDPKKAAAEGNVPLGTIEDILHAGIRKGILLAPPSRIERPAHFFDGAAESSAFRSSPVFTLQWHLTQDCDLHCKHCYDRSSRTAMGLKAAISVLDGLYDFCKSRNVYGQVTFTGGNPFLYPHFEEVYRQAADRGFLTGILGNPVPRKRLEAVLAIRKPEFFQVSLEGLREGNDDIRGRGHFDRVVSFLAELRSAGVYSMVMMTLSAANAKDLLPLSEFLKGRVDLFTFNRLAQVGEGTDLAGVPVADFPDLIDSYLDHANENGTAALKDNLFNILLERRGLPLFGGCAGYGCGAAFNFVSLLPDGEVHACRKFPSPVGHLLQHSLAEIYESEAARRYRAGAAACRGCRLRPVCGGCMAVSYGAGLDPLQERDPYCFL